MAKDARRHPHSSGRGWSYYACGVADGATRWRSTAARSSATPGASRPEAEREFVAGLMTAVLPPDAIEAVAAELRRRLASPHPGYERQGAAAPPDPHGATPKAERVGRPVGHRVPAAPVRGRGRPFGKSRARARRSCCSTGTGWSCSRSRTGWRWPPQRPSRASWPCSSSAWKPGTGRLSVGFPRGQRRPSSTPRCCHRRAAGRSSRGVRTPSPSGGANTGSSDTRFRQPSRARPRPDAAPAGGRSRSAERSELDRHG